MKFGIVIERGKRNFSAFAPDVPGCVATGDTLAEVSERMKEALEFHFEGLLLDDEPIPPATTVVASVDVDVAAAKSRAARARAKAATK